MLLYRAVARICMSGSVIVKVDTDELNAAISSPLSQSEVPAPSYFAPVSSPLQSTTCNVPH